MICLKQERVTSMKIWRFDKGAPSRSSMQCGQSQPQQTIPLWTCHQRTKISWKEHTGIIHTALFLEKTTTNISMNLITMVRMLRRRNKHPTAVPFALHLEFGLSPKEALSRFRSSQPHWEEWKGSWRNANNDMRKEQTSHKNKSHTGRQTAKKRLVFSCHNNMDRAAVPETYPSLFPLISSMIKLLMSSIV